MDHHVLAVALTGGRPAGPRAQGGAGRRRPAARRDAHGPPGHRAGPGGRRGLRLYLAGTFGRVGEQRRRNLAAVAPDDDGTAVAGFEPGSVRTGDAVRLEPGDDDGVLVVRPRGRARAYAADGGPAPRRVGDLRFVSASVGVAGNARLLAGAFRSAAGARGRRGIVLLPRG